MEVKTRELSMVELKYTKIKNKETNDIYMIVGSDNKGFYVSDLEMKISFPLLLPYKNRDKFEIIID